jgi:hypothetical protein
MDNIVIDTNPLVYIYHAVPVFGKKYVALLGELSQKNTLLIPKIVYGELSIIFGSEKELCEFLSDTGIIIGEINSKTYITAAKRWEVYNKRRILMCPKCGKKFGKLTCKKCSAEIRIRQHILTDFIIGAYALQMGKKQLITNDAGYYASYFPELTIMTA